MGFGIFIMFLFYNLLIPFILICFARHLHKRAPNPVSRTYSRYSSRIITMSAENQDVWVSVNLWRAESWRKIGWIMLAGTVGVLFVIGVVSVITKDESIIFGALLVPVLIQFIVGVAALTIIESGWAKKMRL